MSELLLKPDFWQAIVGIAWPITLIIIAVLFRKLIYQLFNRETLTLKVAGMELSVKEATVQTGKGVSDLQERLAILEANFSVSESTKSETNHENNSQLSVLWVDDFPSNNAFIIERLENEGARIRKELSTDSGIGALSNDKFDLIISDLGRVENGRDNAFAGLDFARALRAAGNETPLLIFAGQRGIQHREKLLSAGVNQVTNSPIDVFKFVEAHG